jgi:hypothetical protein
MAQSVGELIVRVLSGEATAEEQLRLDAVLRSDPTLLVEYEDFRALWTSLRELRPLIDAAETRSEQIPSTRLAQLRRIVSDARSGPRGSSEIKLSAKPAGGILGQLKLWVAAHPLAAALRAGTALAAVALAVSSLVLRINQAPTRVAEKTDAVRSAAPVSRDHGPAALQIALSRPAGELARASLLRSMRGEAAIHLYSPIGATRQSRPVIDWKGEPEKQYDLWIKDEFDPNATPLHVSGVVPPVHFGQLVTRPDQHLINDRLYRVRLTEIGQPLSASEYTVRTLAQLDEALPTDATAKLSDATRILREEPSRLGDAFAELSSLPQPVANSALALRLKLFVFGQLGYQEEFEATVKQLSSGR